MARWLEGKVVEWGGGWVGGKEGGWEHRVLGVNEGSGCTVHIHTDIGTQALSSLCNNCTKVSLKKWAAGWSDSGGKGGETIILSTREAVQSCGLVRLYCPVLQRKWGGLPLRRKERMNTRLF